MQPLPLLLVSFFFFLLLFVCSSAFHIDSSNDRLDSTLLFFFLSNTTVSTSDSSSTSTCHIWQSENKKKHKKATQRLFVNAYGCILGTLAFLPPPPLPCPTSPALEKGAMIYSAFFFLKPLFALFHNVTVTDLLRCVFLTNFCFIPSSFALSIIPDFRYTHCSALPIAQTPFFFFSNCCCHQCARYMCGSLACHLQVSPERHS